MAHRKKSEMATLSSHQKHVPPTIATSTAYTSAYMAVQEPSPPLSSPPPPSKSSSSQQFHELPDDGAPSRRGPSRSNRRLGQIIRSPTPDGLVVQSQETADEIRSASSATLLSPGEPSIRPRQSQKAPSSRKGRTQQTTKLINVLIKNKSLLYRCIEEDQNEEEESSKAMMRKISAAVKDRRFQTWRQVKSWTMRHYHRQQRGGKSVSSSASTTRRTRNLSSATRTPFGKNLVPIINIAKMKMHAKTFLNSVKEAIGTRKLRRAFHHRLTCGELPEDISRLIFSPLYLKLCRRRTWKVTAARNANYSESDSSDDDRWSEWEEYGDMSPGHDSDGGGGATSTHPHILPSIEEENSDDIEDDPVERPVSRQRADKPSTPIRTQELAVHDPRVRKNQQDQRRKRHKTRNRDKRRSRCRQPTSPTPQSSLDKLTSRQGPDRTQTQIQVVENPHTRKDTARLSFPPIPSIRPFADLMLPSAIATLDPEVESLFRVEGLVRNTNERGANERTDVDNVGKITSNPQDNPAPKKRSREETVGEEQSKNRSIPSTGYDSRRTHRLRGGAVGAPSSTRQTPAILAAENWRQGLKLAKPLAAKKIPSRAPIPKKISPIKTHRVHGEIQPLMFYSVPTGDATQGSQPLQPQLSEHIRDTAGGRSDGGNKENRAEGSNGAVLQKAPQQRSLSHTSDLSDDDISLPPVEELCERAILARELATSRADIPRITTQTKDQHQPERATQRSNGKRRWRWASSSEDYNISALSSVTSPWKRVKPAVETISR